MRKFLPSISIAAAAASFSLNAAAQDNGPTMLTPVAAAEEYYDIQINEFDQTIELAMETGDFVGLAIAIVRVGEPPVFKTYGHTSVSGGRAVTSDTVFRIASLSKGFASSLVGLAVDEGQLSFDDPATKFAPQLSLFNGRQSSLTLSYLLSHRTGLPPNAYDNLLEAGTSPDAILPQYRKVKPICSIGSCYAYQNITYDIAGRALQSVYDKPYADIVEERLFAPLGMGNASLGSAALMQNGNWARPHKRDRTKSRVLGRPSWIIADIKEPYYKTPAAGGINASIRDMAEWLNAQLGAAPDVLPVAVLDTIHTPQVATRSETRRMRNALEHLQSSQYAYGWRVYDYAGTTAIAHAGSVDGYGAQIVFIPERDTGIVILSNTRSRRFWGIAPMFLDMTLGLPAKDWLALEDFETTASGLQ